VVEVADPVHQVGRRLRLHDRIQQGHGVAAVGGVDEGGDLLASALHRGGGLLVRGLCRRGGGPGRGRGPVGLAGRGLGTEHLAPGLVESGPCRGECRVGLVELGDGPPRLVGHRLEFGVGLGELRVDPALVPARIRVAGAAAIAVERRPPRP
jgi:hypothetical protein